MGVRLGELKAACGGNMERPTKITFGDMREQGVRGILIYCAEYRCSHSIAISGDPWPDDLRLSDIEGRGLRQARRGREAGFQLVEGASAFLKASRRLGSNSNHDR